MELYWAQRVSCKCLLLTCQVFSWRQIVSSSMFSPHSCLFPEDMRAGLDIQMRSGENFHLCALCCCLKKREERRRGRQNVRYSREFPTTGACVAFTWVSKGQMWRSEDSLVCSLGFLVSSAGAYSPDSQQPPCKLRNSQGEIKDCQNRIGAFNSNMRLPRT